MWNKIKAWLGIAQKKADAAFDEAGDVIKDTAVRPMLWRTKLPERSSRR
jgi:hypothetical protein